MHETEIILGKIGKAFVELPISVSSDAVALKSQDSMNPVDLTNKAPQLQMAHQTARNLIHFKK